MPRDLGVYSADDDKPTDVNILRNSNGNDIETKANESFDNGLFFDIKAKRKRLIIKEIIFEAK
jgi:hypothetical protein